MSTYKAKFSLEFKWFLSYVEHNFHILPLKSVIPNFVACLVFQIQLYIDKARGGYLKICPPAIITSGEVIIAEYDAILGQ